VNGNGGEASGLMPFSAAWWCGVFVLKIPKEYTKMTQCQKSVGAIYYV